MLRVYSQVVILHVLYGKKHSTFPLGPHLCSSSSLKKKKKKNANPSHGTLAYRL